MKILKKIISLILVCCCVLSLVACNTSSNNTDNESDTPPANELDTPPANNESDTPPANELDTPPANVLPTNIILSANMLSLSKGDTYQIYAVISPSTAEQSIVYRSLNDSIATIDSQGIITAVNKGNTIIQAETINGLVAVCNVEVSIATGIVEGCMMYQNGATSTSPTFVDAGAVVQLIPTDIDRFPTDYYPSDYYDYEEYGIYATRTDSSGNYELTNIPVGEYRLIVVSSTAKWHLDASLEYFNDIDSYIDKLYGTHIGGFVKQSTKKDNIKIYLSQDYSTYSIINVKKDKTTNKSITYKNYRVIL